MIIDVHRFAEIEKPFWDELESTLDRLERQPLHRMSLQEVEHFHYLYERVSASLARIATFASEQETRRYLESLVARAYSEIHETRERPHRLRPLHWFAVTLPRTFRRHIRSFKLSAAVTLVGCVIGGVMISLDPSSKETLMPFPHLLMNPSQRVAEEERVVSNRLEGLKAQGAAWYVKHNTTVSITTMALGATWGVGTALLLFTNGIMLGAVTADYILDGQTEFLFGWLLPHGSVEIPAILLAGQAGFMIAAALIGRRRRGRMRGRLRAISRDLVTIIGGVAVLLVWAGIVESFLSQYHEPAIPYWTKILFGAAQLVLVVLFLARSGRAPRKRERLPIGLG